MPENIYCIIAIIHIDNGDSQILKRFISRNVPIKANSPMYIEGRTLFTAQNLNSETPMPIPEDDDFLCSEELIQVARDLMVKGFTAFQIRKHFHDNFPAINIFLTRKIMTKSIRLLVSEMTDSALFKAETIEGINYYLRHATPKLAVNLLGLKVKILALMGDDLQQETLEERANKIREFLILAREATSGEAFIKQQDEINNPKPEPEQQQQDEQPEPEEEITADEEQEIKDAVNKINLDKAKALKKKLEQEDGI